MTAFKEVGKPIPVDLKQTFRNVKKSKMWLDQMLNTIEHTNFFENRATEYSKASTRGTWEKAFS
jgi:ribonucleoside-diphosphate reductase beta chain